MRVDANHLRGWSALRSVASSLYMRSGSARMKLYPLFADLSRRAVLGVGGGAVAERKVAGLLSAQAQVTVNAPTLTPQLQRWVAEGRIAYRRDAFQESWLDRVWLVVAATSDVELNRV